MFPSLTKLLQCPICFYSLSLPAAWCQDYGHTICKNCKQHIHFCPYCKSQWSTRRHLLLEQILQNLLRMCKYCHQYMELNVIENHEKRLCQKKSIQCFLFGRKGRCCYTFSRENLLNHLYDRHGRRIWRIFLDETVAVPVKNFFNKKNFSILYEVVFPLAKSLSFHVLLRLHGTKSRKFFCFSLNVIENGNEDMEQYAYNVMIKCQGVEVHSYKGLCLPTFEIPEPPDRYPGGQPGGRIILPRLSPIFTDPTPNIFGFYFKIERH